MDRLITFRRVQAPQAPDGQPGAKPSPRKHPLLRLQQTAGNAAVQRMLEGDGQVPPTTPPVAQASPAPAGTNADAKPADQAAPKTSGIVQYATFKRVQPGVPISAQPRVRAGGGGAAAPATPARAGQPARAQAPPAVTPAAPQGQQAGQQPQAPAQGSRAPADQAPAAVHENAEETAEQVETVADAAQPEAEVEAPAEAGEAPSAAEQAQQPAPAGGQGGGGERKEAVATQEITVWRRSVSKAAGGIPAPKIEGAAAAHQQVKKSGGDVAAARRADTEGIPAEGEAAVSPPPVPENQPPQPPADDPIPDKTSAVTAASNQRLPKQELPALVRSPQGNTPRLGQRPVPQEDFRLLVASPATVEAAQLEEKDLKRLAEFQNDLLAEPPVTQKEGAGQPAPLEDKGPAPPTPLPEERRSELTQVLARLLANPRGAAEQMLGHLRERAYPRGVLQKEYPDIGKEELLGDLETSLTAELEAIRAEAGIADVELKNAVKERQAQLEQEQQKANKDHAEATDAAHNDVNKAGKEAMNSIAGTRDQLNQRTERQAAAAGGETSPEVIELRRDNYLASLRRTVAEQLGNYQDAAETREQQLSTSEKNYADAYRFAAQQDEYKLIQPPRDPNAKENQVLAAESRAWADERTREVRETIRLLKRDATTAAGTLRKNMETAATNARTSIRDWADELISEHRSWWENLWETIKRWRTEANEQTEGWEVSRTKQTTAAVSRDLGFIRQVEQMAAADMSQEAILAAGKLTDEQRAIVEAYFQGGKSDPLGAVAAGLRVRLAKLKRPMVNQRLEKLVIAKPFADWGKLNHIGQAQSGGFNADDIASRVYNAMDQIGTDENTIYTALANLTPVQSAAVKKRYRAEHGEELEDALGSEMEDEELRRAKDLLESNQAAAAAAAINEAVSGLGTDEATIMSVLRNKTPEEREQIRAIYQQRYGESLDDALKGDLNDREKERADALLEGNNARADAVAMDDALRGGWFGGSRKDSEAVFNTVREEVKAQAAREGWTTAQMEAEITRRNRDIEASYNSRYADEVKHDEGESALRAAIGQNLDQQYHVTKEGQYERNEGERQLVLGLLDNDLARVDAARIRIEQEDPNYADDDAINRVLRQQYDRSLEEAQRDRAPEMRRAGFRSMQKEMEAAEKAGHPWTPAQQWERQQKIEREVSRTLEREARSTAETRMGNLGTLYQSQYGENLGTVIEQNMSGDDRKEARVLMKQGGYLTPYQRIDFATRGIGTREDEIREALRGRTQAEINEIEKEWAKKHNGETLRSALQSELSGRDEFDMVDIGLQGAPETAYQHINQMRERHRYETEESGIFASAAAGPQREWMDARMAELEETADHMYDKNLTPEKRSAILDEFEERSDFMDRAIEDHRKAIDSAANTAAMIVGAVVGIAVGILSGGTLGPVVAALLGALASTAATMATKRLIQGSAYGIEEFGFDAAIGVVDALTSILTAGMGGKLLGQAVKGGTATIPKAGVGRLVAKLGNSSLFKGLNKMDTGLLGRGIKGTGPLARMAASKSIPARVFANVVAEGGESLISAFPSALTGAALDDEVWRGENPFGKVLTNTAIQTGQGAAASLLFQGAFRGGAHLRGRMRGPAAHFSDTSAAIRESWKAYSAENPKATYQDFANMMEAQRARVVGHGPDDADLNAPHQVEGESARLREGETPTAPREAEPAAAPTRPADGTAPRSTDATTTPRPTDADADAAPTRTAEAPDAEPAARPREGETEMRPLPVEEPGAPARMAEDGAPAPAKSAGQPEAAAPAARPSGETPATHKGVAEQLREGLPKGLRDKVPVEVNPKLSGRDVEVHYTKGPGGTITDVRIVAAPGARPIDILMHTPTVQAMRRYSGLSGRVRNLLDRVRAFITRNPHIPPGSTAWEAELELRKLPGIIEERMQTLRRGDLDPAERAALLDEVGHLSRQIDAHQRALDAMDLDPGRGYVAAQGSGKSGKSKVLPNKQKTRPPGRKNTKVTNSRQVKAGETARMTKPAFERPHAGRKRWYRQIEITSPTGVKRVIDEILMISGHNKGNWQISGHSVTKKGTNLEVASRAMTQAENVSPRQPGHTQKAINVQNKSGQGLDEVVFRFDQNGNARVAFVEVKDSPGGLTRKHFTAIEENVVNNRDTVLFEVRNNWKKHGLTPAERTAILKALKNSEIDVEIRLGPDTTMGTRATGLRKKGILRAIQRNLRRWKFPGGDVHVPDWQRIPRSYAEEAIQAADKAAGAGTKRAQQLATPTGDKPSAHSLRQARAVIDAEKKGLLPKGTQRAPAKSKAEFVGPGGEPITVIPVRSYNVPKGSFNYTEAGQRILKQVRTRRTIPPSPALLDSWVLLELSNMRTKDRADLLNWLKANATPAELARIKHVQVI